MYSTFLNRACDQVNLDVGLHRLPVVFALDRAGITGDDGPSHHGVLDLALLTKVPGMTVFAPSSAQELQTMLHDALELCVDGPSAIRYPKGAARQVGPNEVGSGLRARKARSGDGSLCILAVGKMLEAAEQAADRLAADFGVSATVWDPRVVQPLDPAMIADAARHRAVITIEDGIVDGGVGSHMAAAIMAAATGPVPIVESLGVPLKFIPHGKPDRILARLGLTSDGIVGRARALAERLAVHATEA